VIVEGYMDVVGVHQAGYQNVVATMGTALSQRHLTQLRRMAKRIVLALDPDAAGDDATLRNVELASEVLDRREVPVPTASGRIRFEQSIDADLRVARLPDGVDPDELVQQDPAAWPRLIAESRPVVDFVFDSVLETLDPGKPEDRDAARERLLPVIREISDRIQQAHYLQRLARVVQVDERLLRLEMTRRGRSRKPSPTSDGQPVGDEAASEPTRASLNSNDRYALWLALTHAQLWPRLGELSPEWLRDPDARRIFLGLRESESPQQLRERLRELGLDEVMDSIVDVERPPMSVDEVDTVWDNVMLQLRRRWVKERVDALGLMCQEAFKEGDAERVAALGLEIQQLTGALLEIDRSTRSPHRAAFA
jgi:DNA primase